MKNIVKRLLTLKIILALSIVLFLSGCSAQEKSKYEKDYDLLWDELENSYPYLTYIDENVVGIDELRSRYALELNSVDNESEFSELLQRMFSEMRNLAHLDVLSQDMYQEYYYLYVLNNIEDSNSTEPYSEILQDNRLADIYTKPISIESFENQEISNQEVYTQYYSDQNALYIKIPSFAHEFKERDKNVISDAIEKYPETENVIFDITGNRGGSDYYWMDNIVSPFGGNYKITIRNFFKTSSTTEKYLNNENLSSLTSDLNDAPEWADELGLDKCEVYSFNIPEEPMENIVIPGNIKKWVLTSRYVYSASDKFAYFCKSTGWATLVGSQTSGDGLGTTPILVLLPESGLLVRFSATAGENSDGTMNAISGTSPDVTIIKNESPLDKCLELIATKSK